MLILVGNKLIVNGLQLIRPGDDSGSKRKLMHYLANVSHLAVKFRLPDTSMFKCSFRLNIGFQTLAGFN